MRQPDFLIVSLPRSRSAWLANFMTTDTTLCLHDPLGMMARGEQLPDDTTKMYGWADTALGQFPDKVRDTNARTLIVERDPEEVILAVQHMGLPLSEQNIRDAVMHQAKTLKVIYGLRIQYDEIDDRLASIWHFLTLGKPFDPDRAKLLKTFDVQLNTAGVLEASKFIEAKS